MYKTLSKRLQRGRDLRSDPDSYKDEVWNDKQKFIKGLRIGSIISVTVKRKLEHGYLVNYRYYDVNMFLKETDAIKKLDLQQQVNVRVMTNFLHPKKGRRIEVSIKHVPKENLTAKMRDFFYEVSDIII